ncbi:MAG: endonuclease III domain-containing protein [Dehalococcoidia bacterium]
MRQRLLEVSQRLERRHGPQHWWPADGTLEVVIGAILTQAAAWTNVERALKALRDAGALSIQGLRELSPERLAQLIRPSGYFNAKARKVKAFIDYLWERHGGDLARMLSQDGEHLRRELLSIYGIGEETADDILLYAAEKPSFVVDTYTRRILQRLGLAPKSERYDAYQELFHRHLPPNPQLFNEYHALLVRHGKETCRKEPRCQECCLLDLCPTGRRRVPA